MTWNLYMEPYAVSEDRTVNCGPCVTVPFHRPTASSTFNVSSSLKPQTIQCKTSIYDCLPAFYFIC